AVARQVAGSTAPLSMPAAASTACCTKIMYAVVRNVVAPATNSVRTVVPFSFSRKRRSSMARSLSEVGIAKNARSRSSYFRKSIYGRIIGELALAMSDGLRGKEAVRVSIRSKDRERTSSLCETFHKLSSALPQGAGPLARTRPPPVPCSSPPLLSGGIRVSTLVDMGAWNRRRSPCRARERLSVAGAPGAHHGHGPAWARRAPEPRRHD